MSEKSIGVEIRIYLVKNGLIVGGRGLVEVLEAIRDTGSLSLAAERLGLSYKKLWFMVDRAEKLLGVRLVERKRGRGGSTLTRIGEEVIRLYRDAEARVKECSKT